LGLLGYVWFGLVFVGNGTSAASSAGPRAHASRDLLQGWTSEEFRRSKDEQEHTLVGIGMVLKGCSVPTEMSPSPVATDIPSERDLLRETEV